MVTVPAAISARIGRLRLTTGRVDSRTFIAAFLTDGPEFPEM
jgi:hypothetical protein